MRPSGLDRRQGRWTPTGEFTVGGRPTITSADPDINVTLRTIAWEAVDGADSYEIYLYHDRFNSLDETGGLKLIRRTKGITETTFSTPPLQHGDYRVWVRSHRDNDGQGKWSKPFRFSVFESDIHTKPTPIAPAVAGFDLTSEFTWAVEDETTRFDLYATDGQTVIWEPNVEGNSWTPASPLAAHFWTWQVRTQDSDVAGPWSDALTVDLSGRAVLLQPALFDTDTTPTIAWAVVGGASDMFCRLTT